MATDFKGRSFLSLYDFTPQEVQQMLDATRVLKQQFLTGNRELFLKGKTLGMIFQKPSTRTRVSFEVAMYQLGGWPLYLSANELQLKRGETIADTARVLSRYVNALVARVYAHQDVVDLAQYASVPVINALSDYCHPCQGLADLFTIYEKRLFSRPVRAGGQTFKDLKITYIGDGNNVAHSLIFGVAKVGGHLIVATPPDYEPNDEVVRQAKQDADSTGGSIEVITDPVKAAQDADVLYTDVWTSMGQEEEPEGTAVRETSIGKAYSEREKRLQAFKPYQINIQLVKYAKPDVLIMHCLPAHRGEEITDEVMDSPNSIVFDQAENRLYTQKAILVLLMR